MIQQIINNFYNFIKNKNWTQCYAAKLIGCHPGHLSKIFHKERIPSMTLLNEMEKVMNKYGKTN